MVSEILIFKSDKDLWFESKIIRILLITTFWKNMNISQFFIMNNMFCYL